MSNQARIGDIVRIDCPHGPQTGIIVTGSQYDYADGIPIARLTDTITCTACGETGNIVTGSEYVYDQELKYAKIDDIGIGTCNYGCKTCPHDATGVIVTGSPTVYTK
jgi:uncharacterized Zn-binding protein involved in type VI secretion